MKREWALLKYTLHWYLLGLKVGYVKILLHNLSHLCGHCSVQLRPNSDISPLCHSLDRTIVPMYQLVNLYYAYSGHQSAQFCASKPSFTWACRSPIAWLASWPRSSVSRRLASHSFNSVASLWKRVTSSIGGSTNRAMVTRKRSARRTAGSLWYLKEKRHRLIKMGGGDKDSNTQEDWVKQSINYILGDIFNNLDHPGLANYQLAMSFLWL